MVTLPAYRGRGYASRLLRETQATWFEPAQATAGLLLCADHLLPFYSRLGWHRISGRVRYAQPAGEREWAASCMLLDPRAELPHDRCIDLCGLPW
jgi:hypothetical protein